MRKFILLFFTAFVSLSAFAQLEIKPNSFKEVAGFVNINRDKMYDDNDKPYAVLKIKTEKITDKQRRELLFQGDARTFFEVEYQTGEVWLYISYYASFIKISHPDLSSTEFYFPFDMKPKKGYELTLINVWTEEGVVMNSMTIKADQPEARIFIDDDYVGDGEFSKAFPAGETHSWRIDCDMYHGESGSVDVLVGDSIVIEKKLRPAFGFINVTSTPVSGATVFIDGKKMGETPYKSDRLVSGKYKVKIVKDSYNSNESTVTVTDESTVDVSMSLYKKYNFMTVNVAMNQYGQPSFGLTYGSMKKFGWFVSAMTNFNFSTKSDFTCNAEYFVDGYYPGYTGKESYSSLSFLGGVLLNFSEHVALRIGAGYGIRMKRYETDNGYWVKNGDISAQGLDLSLGAQGRFGGLVFSIDGVATNFKVFEARIGIGLGFKNK